MIFGGVHSFVAHRMNIVVRTAVSYKKVFLLSITYASYLCRVDHPQALKSMTVNSKPNSHICLNL